MSEHHDHDDDREPPATSSSDEPASLAPAHDDDDWEARELCPDDTCIGTLDDEGRCGICGARGTPPVRRAGSSSEAATPAPLEDEDEDHDADDLDESEDESERELCYDDTCIGTLGADGRCGICGRSF